MTFFPRVRDLAEQTTSVIDVFCASRHSRLKEKLAEVVGVSKEAACLGGRQGFHGGRRNGAV